MAWRVHYPQVRRSSSMARIIHFLATGALLIGGSVALGQTTERSGAAAQASGQATAGASANQNEQSASLAAGTAVNAQLSQTIDSKKAKAGEPVTAQTTDAVKSDGKVIIPKGTRCRYRSRFKRWHQISEPPQ